MTLRVRCATVAPMIGPRSRAVFAPHTIRGLSLKTTFLCEVSTTWEERLISAIGRKVYSPRSTVLSEGLRVKHGYFARSRQIRHLQGHRAPRGASDRRRRGLPARRRHRRGGALRRAFEKASRGRNDR